MPNPNQETTNRSTKEIPEAKTEPKIEAKIDSPTPETTSPMATAHSETKVLASPRIDLKNEDTSDRSDEETMTSLIENLEVSTTDSSKETVTLKDLRASKERTRLEISQELRPTTMENLFIGMKITLIM